MRYKYNQRKRQSSRPYYSTLIPTLERPLSPNKSRQSRNQFIPFVAQLLELRQFQCEPFNSWAIKIIVFYTAQKKKSLCKNRIVSFFCYLQVFLCIIAESRHSKSYLLFSICLYFREKKAEMLKSMRERVWIRGEIV